MLAFTGLEVKENARNNAKKYFRQAPGDIKHIQISRYEKLLWSCWFADLFFQMFTCICKTRLQKWIHLG